MYPLEIAQENPFYRVSTIGVTAERIDTQDRSSVHDNKWSKHIFSTERLNGSKGQQNISSHIPNKHQRATAPIGIFDSGAGGLSILATVRAQLPHEDYIYMGDTAHCPYGVKSNEEITRLTLQSCNFLLAQNVKMIIVACNTASQAALSTLRSSIALPFIGVVPAIKPAAELSRVGRIGVAATSSTAQAAYLQDLIHDFAGDTEVYSVGCPELVTLVEQGKLDGPLVDNILRENLQPLLEKQVDVLVLGCTHFPLLRPAIERVVGENVQVIDSGAAIARRTNSILQTEKLTHPEQQEGQLQIWCSGDANAFSNVASAILGYPVTVRQATL